MSKAGLVSHHPLAPSITGTWRKRGIAAKRSASVRRSRSMATGASKTMTPTIIIRLCGRSMRSHAMSMLGMRSRVVMGDRSPVRG
jgi:hypothetical protein